MQGQVGFAAHKLALVTAILVTATGAGFLRLLQHSRGFATCPK